MKVYQTKWLLIVFVILSFINAIPAMSQELKQTVRGKIIDEDTQVGLPGANVVVIGSDPILGAGTDVNGEFRIDHVPVGRISLKVSFIGYEDRIVPNILVTTGKEILLDIVLRESLISMDEIVVVAGKDKTELANDMALISARGFTVEETKRYAGSFNDPARMVSGYAGVTGDASGNNFIVVRGNSPKGVQWRLEGIEIPNPNHFSDEGATGGPINALNSEMLANSEFYTGAFAPEFGNALSGVFDMQLRKGNNEQREYSASIGILGTGLTAEGPFTKKGKSSFLVNYRYSTLSILNDLGLVDFDGIPKYQDLSYKIYLPTRNFGTFSVFGLGGKSNILEKVYDKVDEDDLVSQGNYQADMGVTGITQYWSFGANTYLQNSVTFSKNGSGYLGYEPDDQEELIRMSEAHLDKKTVKVASTLNHKVNAQHKFQIGGIYTRHNFDFYSEYFDEPQNRVVIGQNQDGNAGQYQGFVSWKFRPWEALSIVSGVHVQGTTLNDKQSIEPRASLRWQLNSRQAVTAGFGIHGKLESLTNYYSIVSDENGNTSQPNMELDFTKARHYVVGYENKLGENLLLKMEAYYQQLYNVPVEDLETSSYSLINQVEWFTDRKVVNKGTGHNYGLELTLERYFADNYFFMLTTSLYDSKYKALDNIERNTLFNANYAGNFLFGKEFEISKTAGKKKVIGINTKVSLQGARRYTPIDLQASIDQDKTVYYESEAFSRRGDNILIANISVVYRVDHKKTSQEFKLDIQNVTNNAARLEQYYDSHSQTVENNKQLPMLPVLMYTIHF